MVPFRQKIQIPLFWEDPIYIVLQAKKYPLGLNLLLASSIYLSLFHSNFLSFSLCSLISFSIQTDKYSLSLANQSLEKLRPP